MPIQSCTSTPSGSVRADYCADGIEYGPIDRLFFTRIGDGLTDWTSEAEWLTRLSQTTPFPSTGDASIRMFHVIGSLAEPEQTETKISLGRIKQSPPEFTFTFIIDDVGDLNYAFMQALVEARGGQYAVWLEGHGKMYGGNEGIQASMKLSYTIPTETTAQVAIPGTLRWSGTMPDRIATPLTS